MNYVEETRDLLWLVMVWGAGSPKIWEVLRMYGSASEARMACQTGKLAKKMNVRDTVQRRFRETQDDKVEEMLSRLEALEIGVLSYKDDLYPADLREVTNAPVLLFYQGQPEILRDRLCLTIVGTRHPSAYSLRVEKLICDDLVRQGVVPVTGFAEGVDIQANKAALDAGAPSVAVLGTGIDVQYPKSHYTLKARIAENGLVLTEQLPGMVGRPGNFPLRNRILAGITPGTWMVQAPEQSGTLITAELALEQGKDIFCLPPADVFDKHYTGVIKYLRDGATPVFDSGDILYTYYGSSAHTMHVENFAGTSSKSDSVPMEHTARPSVAQPPIQEDVSAAAVQDTTPKEKSDTAPTPETPKAAPEKSAVAARPMSYPADTPEGQVLLLLRENHVMHIDQIADQTGFAMDKLVAYLTELELEGDIERRPGKQFQAVE